MNMSSGSAGLTVFGTTNGLFLAASHSLASAASRSWICSSDSACASSASASSRSCSRVSLELGGDVIIDLLVGSGTEGVLGRNRIEILRGDCVEGGERLHDDERPDTDHETDDDRDRRPKRVVDDPISDALHHPEVYDRTGSPPSHPSDRSTTATVPVNSPTVLPSPRVTVMRYEPSVLPRVISSATAVRVSPWPGCTGQDQMGIDRHRRTGTIRHQRERTIRQREQGATVGSTHEIEVTIVDVHRHRDGVRRLQANPEEGGIGVCVEHVGDRIRHCLDGRPPNERSADTVPKPSGIICTHETHHSDAGSRLHVGCLF